MSFSVRDGSFDLVIVAGPRLPYWPSAGACTLSAIAADFGLSVGIFGGEGLVPKGVVPLSGTGGLVLIEDSQRRIHRIRAKAVVRFSPPLWFPDAFRGWRSAGLIPLVTARKLIYESKLSWQPGVAILGSGNSSFKFANQLLLSDVPNVYCIEHRSEWGAKRYSGWEVERRRFELLGGKFIEGRPISLKESSPTIWELAIESKPSTQTLTVSRVISAGPFTDVTGVREHPVGSLLFDVIQTSDDIKDLNIEGWSYEEDRAKFLAVKIIKALMEPSGAKREKLEKIFSRSKLRLKRHSAHSSRPFSPVYQGKWISSSYLKEIQSFSGVPKTAHKSRYVASVECFEDIECDICKRACPSGALELNRAKRRILDEQKCTGCGSCLRACPSSAICLLKEDESKSKGKLVLPWLGSKKLKTGELVLLLNRRGESLESARVAEVKDLSSSLQQLYIDVPSHLLWEARGIKITRAENINDDVLEASEKTEKLQHDHGQVEIMLDGDRRFVRDGVSVSVALFETGKSRAVDTLYCSDGSCGQCYVTIDGAKKLACKSIVHRGMSIKLPKKDNALVENTNLCMCLGVSEHEVVEHIKRARLHSPDAVVAMTHVGEGGCHSAFCGSAFRRLLEREGIDARIWIDWRFPWSEWKLNSLAND